MQAQPLAADFVVHLLDERVVGIEPRHLVLVLVGHQLEQVACDRLGQPAFPGRTRRLGRFRPLHPSLVARGTGRILIEREEGEAPRDRFIERLRKPARIAGRLRRRLDQRLERGEIDGGTAAPIEAALFIATASPLSSIACSIDAAASGTAPS